ncbi:MAG TPA: potassium channel family protein [Dongiaceae bacterium]|nr:potassium channel family protein [Dongiaceae bacterium]
MMDDLVIVIIRQLAIAALLVTTTVIMHFFGLFLLTAFVRVNQRRLSRDSMHIDQIAVLIAAVLGVFAIHSAEIWLYALFYDFMHVFKTLEDALYFSLTSYATIGYGDVVLSHEWRILGAIEGVNGILLLGWSIAFLVAVVGRFRHMQHR